MDMKKKLDRHRTIRIKFAEVLIREFEFVIKKENIFFKFESLVRRYCTTIIDLAPPTKKRKTVKKRIKRAKNEAERIWRQMVGSLLLLPSCVKESRKDTLIYESKDSKPEDPYPYIYVTSTNDNLLDKTANLSIIMEGVEICKSRGLLKAYLTILAIHYVFDAKYNPRCINTFAVLEKFVEYTDETTEISTVVEELFEKLQQTCETPIL